MPRAATKAAKKPIAPPPTPKTYSWNWDTLLNGEVWELEPGEDYGDATEFQQAMGLEVIARRIKSVSTQVTEQYIVIQASTERLPEVEVIEERPDGSPVDDAPVKPPIDLSSLTIEQLVAEIRRRERMPVGVLRDGTWFTWATPGGPESLGCKLDGGMETDVKAAITRRDGKSCKEQMHIASGTLVYVVPTPDEHRPPVKVAEPKSANNNGAPAPAQAKPGGSPVKSRYELFGVSVTAVVRALGKMGWDFDKTQAALKRVGAEAAEATVRIQLRAGVKGERGEPAKLTADQIKQLESK